ncbi:MAG: DUF3592 domain-containing protein [Pseudomonadota bacterium]
MDFMLWYVVIACSGAALLCLYFSWRAFWLWKSIPNWPTVKGQVVSSQSERMGRYPRSSYALVVKIRYTYRGDTYNNTHPIPGGAVSRSEAGVNALADMLTVGTVVRLFVNPMKPKEAYIERVAPWRIFALILCVLIFGTAGGKVLYDNHDQARAFMDGEFRHYAPALGFDD